MSRRRLAVLVSSALIALAASGCSPSGSDVKPEAITIAPDEHTLGSPSAPVTLIEYAAPSCPVCAAFDRLVFPQVKSTYIDTGKVRYVFRIFPLRPADGAAEAIARCLPKESYMDFIEVLFQRQPQWDPEFGVEDAHGELLKIARLAGLTGEKADQCIQDPAAQKRINEIATEGQTRFHVRATPTIVINGQILPSGSLPWAQLQPLIEEALRKAAASAPAPH